MESQEYKDKVITCVDCGSPFAFLAGEQRFYYSKRLTEPKRCQACRELRKRTLNPKGVNDG